MTRIVNGVCAAHGATAEFNTQRSYPATINHAGNREGRRVAATIVGDENVDRDVKPSMGAEDFAYMLQESPASISGSAPAKIAPSCTARITISTTSCCPSGRPIGRNWWKTCCPLRQAETDGQSQDRIKAGSISAAPSPTALEVAGDPLRQGR